MDYAKIRTLLRPLLPFFGGLGIALVAALLYPPLGAKNGPLQTGWLTQAAVVIIFFVQGLQLPLDEVRRGAGAWKLHVFCQSWIFLGVPLLVIICGWPFRHLIPVELQIGILFLAALPTTVATNAAFTAQAGGNVAAALFNICIANLAGIFLAPSWLAWLIARGTDVSIPLLPMFAKIVLQLLLPFVLGQLARFALHGWAGKNRALLSRINSYLIFFIIYAAICDFRLQPATSGSVPLLVAAGWTTAMLVLVKAVCWWTLRLTHWPVELQIAGFFCASQKTLAAGLPVAAAVIAASPVGPGIPTLAVLVLPLLIYHIGQLVIGAFCIPVWMEIAKRGR